MALDAATLDACYRRVERGLYNVLYRWLWDAQACQDVMHDCFLRLWDRRAGIDPAGLDALVYATALNLARNRLRWQRLRRWVGLELAEQASHDASAGLGELERTVASHQLRRALEQLPSAERDLLLLSEFSGFGTAELASLLGIAPGTVGSRKHRTLARLRAILGADHE